jgi:hypothetical protein
VVLVAVAWYSPTLQWASMKLGRQGGGVGGGGAARFRPRVRVGGAAGGHRGDASDEEHGVGVSDYAL